MHAETLIILLLLVGLMPCGCPKTPDEGGKALPLVNAAEQPPPRSLTSPFSYDSAVFALRAESSIRVVDDTFEPGDEFLVWFDAIGPFQLDAEELAHIGMQILAKNQDGQVVYQTANPAAVRLPAHAPFFSVGAKVVTGSDWPKGEYELRIEVDDDLAKTEILHEDTFTLE